MGALRYGISLPVFNSIVQSKRREQAGYRVEHEKRNSISTSRHILFVYHSQGWQSARAGMWPRWRHATGGLGGQWNGPMRLLAQQAMMMVMMMTHLLIRGGRDGKTSNYLARSRLSVFPLTIEQSRLLSCSL